MGALGLASFRLGTGDGMRPISEYNGSVRDHLRQLYCLHDGLREARHSVLLSKDKTLFTRCWQSSVSRQ